MPKIELWEKAGKGVFKVLHNAHRPIALVVLENRHGDSYTIFEGNNEVPAGDYEIVIIRPYEKDQSRVITRRGVYDCEVRNGSTVHIVDIGDFAGGYMPLDGDSFAWKKMANSDKLERPIGWSASNAMQMIDAFNNLMG